MTLAVLIIIVDELYLISFIEYPISDSIPPLY